MAQSTVPITVSIRVLQRDAGPVLAGSAARWNRASPTTRNLRCHLSASVTSFNYVGAQLVGIEYHEPAKDLLPVKGTKKFVAGA